MIDSIDISKLRNSEFIQFLSDVLDITNVNNPIALNIKDQFDNLSLSRDTLSALFVTEKGSTITDVVAALDTRRDRAIVGISTVANGFTYHFDAAIAKHATDIGWQIGQYGNSIAKENYQSQTTIITSLVADLKSKPELIAAVTALQLTTWVAELEAANIAFNNAYLQRTQQLGAASPDTILAKRLEANANYYELRNYIDSYFIINKGALPFSKATNELNALIAQYNTMMAGKSAAPKVPPVVPTP
jgi:hypothetical protein